MVLHEMMQKAQAIIEVMRSQGFPEHVCDGTLSLISSNECQVALENLCENIYEFDFVLDSETKEKLNEVLDYFEIKESYRALV